MISIISNSVLISCRGLGCPVDIGVSVTLNDTCISEKAIKNFENDANFFSESVIHCLKKVCKYPYCRMTVFEIENYQINKDKVVHYHQTGDIPHNATINSAQIRFNRPVGGELVFEFYPAITATECISFISSAVGLWYGFSMIKCKRYFKRKSVHSDSHNNCKVQCVSQRIKLRNINRMRNQIYY